MRPSEARLRASLEHLRQLVGRSTEWVLLVVAVAGVPLMHRADRISTKTVNELGYYAALALVGLGLDLIWGYVGVLCLCMSLFFGIGVYAMAMHLALHGSHEGGLPRSLHEVTSAVDTPELPWHWEPFHELVVTVPVGLGLAAALAFAIGYFGFASRVRGVYFAVLTQALALAGWVTFQNTDLKLGGTTGIRNFLTIAGFDLNKESTVIGLYVLTVLTLAAVYSLCRWLVASRFGRVLIAVRDNEDRLRFSGYRVHRFKLLVFVLAATIAALGGMLYTPQKGSINPAMVTVEKSILVVIWVAVGGRGTLSGAVVGAMVIQLLENFLTSQHQVFWLARWVIPAETYSRHLRPVVWQPEYWQYVLGGLFVVVVLWFPGGLVSAWRRASGPPHQLAGKPHSRGSVPLAVQTAPVLPDRLAQLALLRRAPRDAPVPGDLLRIENLAVIFDGFKALDIVSFKVPFYGLQVIIGPNGAGKTTLCDVISGKTRPATGKVFFGGHDITRKSEVEIARLGVGRKFQTPTVFDSLSVNENMVLALPGRQQLMHNFRRQTSQERERVRQILERVRLADQSQQLARYLSHGQRQWLEIGMLVLSDPRLLLVDEPAAGLTDEETVLTAELLLELQSEHAIIVIEHDMDFVRLLDSKVTVLNEGQIMAQGTMDEVQADPRVVEAYLGR